MTTINDAFPKPHLKAHDLGGKPRVVTVSRFMMKELWDRKAKEKVPKPVLYFKGVPKYLCLNPTTWEQIVSITGEETAERWAGRAVELFPTQEVHGGETWQVIRVRKPSQQAQSKQPAPSNGNPVQEIGKVEYRRLVDKLGLTDEDALAVYRSCESNFPKAYAYLEKEYADLLEQ